MCRRVAGVSSDVGDAQPGVGLVPPVDRDQVRGQRLDLVGVAQPTGVHPAHARDRVGQGAHQVGRVAVLALAEHQDVGVDRGDLRVVEHDRADVVERRDHVESGSSAAASCAADPSGTGERVRALLVEAERVHAVDHDLAGEHRRPATAAVGVTVVRARHDDDVAGRGSIGVAEPAYVAAGRLGQLGRGLGGAVRRRGCRSRPGCRRRPSGVPGRDPAARSRRAPRRSARRAPPSDRGPVEVLERARRRRAALALVARAVLLRAVRVLRGRREPEEAELPDLHARVELDRQRRDVRQLERDVAGEARVDEPGGRVGEQPEPPERRLALDAGGDVVGQRDHLVRRPEHELARVQDERLVALRLDHPGQVGLVGGRVDVRVAVVLEHPEEPVEPHVDRRRLQHRRRPTAPSRSGPRRSRPGCRGRSAARSARYRPGSVVEEVALRPSRNHAATDSETMQP